MQTQSSDYWSGVRDSFTATFFDALRSRVVDVEGGADDRNIPDNVDVRTGQAGGAAYAPAPAGIPVAGWVLLGVAVVAGAMMFGK